MNMFWDFIYILLCFVFVIAVCYAYYDADEKKENIGKSVVVNGDTLKIVEWTKYHDLYILENNLVIKYDDYE